MFRKGVTFIELLVAISLMSFLFSLGWAISSSLLGVKKIRNFEVAIMLANQAVEAARAARYRELGDSKENRKDTLLADFSSADNIFDGEKGEGFIPIIKVGNTEFKRELEIREIPSLIQGFPTKLKLFRVVVKWKAPEDGEPMVFETVTTISEQ